MVLLLVLSGVLAVCAPVRATYDRLAARRYARDYWDTVCSDNHFFVDSEGPTQFEAGEHVPTDEEGFDCAHFVSCCIGSEPNEPAGGLDVPSRTLAYGEPGAQRLVDWLVDQGAAGVDRISALVPGDVVAYDADRNGWIEHVALYMGNGLVTAHSISRYSEWNPNPEADVILLHLPGAYEPPWAERALSWISWTVVVVALTGLAAAILAVSRH